jgi:serine/threonine protein kinase
MKRIGDYEIERETESGYEARHVVLPRRVQLTVMHPTFVGLKPVAVRMMREACILEALRHPGVPRVYEVGVIADGRSQRPWVASELVEGTSLGDSLFDGDLVAVDELIDIIRQVADVLAHAHARNVAHRGIRAEAILRCDLRGHPICVINWSEARVPDATDDTDRAFADDMFALGLVADLAIASRAGVPAALTALVDDMLAPNPMSRPSAADVVTRCRAIRDTLEAKLEVDLDLDVEDLLDVRPAVRVEQWRDTDTTAARRALHRQTTPPPIPVSRARLRWTPATGIDPSVIAAARSSVRGTQTAEALAAIGPLPPRRS